MDHWRSTAPSPRSEYVLNAQQIDALLSNTVKLRDRVILELFVYCGLRLDEMATLEIGRFDFAAGDFTVIGKGKKIRRVPMPPFVAAHVKQWIGRRLHGYMFPGRDGPHLTDQAIQDVVRIAGERIGFKQRCPGLVHLNPHLLRHTCARRMKDAGTPWEVIAKILGHKNLLKVIQLYGTLTFEEVKKEFLKVTPA